jgi:transposase-like protein
MMLDANVVACSPASVYRVLKTAGLLAGQSPKPTKKGTGFVQPIQPHEHWHIDISYLNIAGTFYFLCTVLDGCSRFVVHWEIREKMAEKETEIVVQRARELVTGATPRIITDNGPQFIAKDFKEFIRIAGMTHVKTSPYYPQSNGKIERWHKTLKGDCIRTKVPLSLDDARRIVAEFVTHYNQVRLHSAIGYVTPKDRLEGREKEIFAERDRKLAEARQRRKEIRASTPPNRPAPVANRPAIDFAEFRTRLSIKAVLDLLGFQPRTTHGAQQRGPCPLHGSTSATSRSFSANLEKNLFHCFKCGKSGNALDLWGHAQRLSTYDAAVELSQRLNVSLPQKASPNPLPRNREEEPVTQNGGVCIMS